MKLAVLFLCIAMYTVAQGMQWITYFDIVITVVDYKINHSQNFTYHDELEVADFILCTDFAKHLEKNDNG